MFWYHLMNYKKLKKIVCVFVVIFLLIVGFRYFIRLTPDFTISNFEKGSLKVATSQHFEAAPFMRVLESGMMTSFAIHEKSLNVGLLFSPSYYRSLFPVLGYASIFDEGWETFLVLADNKMSLLTDEKFVIQKLSYKRTNKQVGAEIFSSDNGYVIIVSTSGGEIHFSNFDLQKKKVVKTKSYSLSPNEPVFRTKFFDYADHIYGVVSSTASDVSEPKQVKMVRIDKTNGNLEILKEYNLASDDMNFIVNNDKGIFVPLRMRSDFYADDEAYLVSCLWAENSCSEKKMTLGAKTHGRVRSVWLVKSEAAYYLLFNDEKSFWDVKLDNEMNFSGLPHRLMDLKDGWYYSVKTDGNSYQVEWGDQETRNYYDSVHKKVFSAPREEILPETMSQNCKKGYCLIHDFSEDIYKLVKKP